MSADSVLGIPTARVRDAVAAVAEATDLDAVETVFARAAWSTIAEPGDALAGAAIASLGPAAALAALIRNDASLLQGSIDSSPRAVAEAVARWRPRLVSEEVLGSLARARDSGVRFVTPECAAWPEQLDDLGLHGPVGLWVLGDSGALGPLARSVALVGSRASSAYGERVTIELAAGLVARRFAVVSGAAYGIDGIAHRAALMGDGLTVAFLAGGVDRFYPVAHTDLLTRIAATGAVVSEVPCGTAPTRWRFLQRNRLIAAAAAATVVVEAGSRSGSINTAGHAATLGRPLGAVPGSVESASSAGCHRLLREYDAVCVTSAEDAAELVAPGDVAVALPPRTDGDPTLIRVHDALGDRATSVESIAQRAGLSIAEAEGALLLLELDRSAVASGTGWRRG